MMSTLEAALSLAARGFHVFPCRVNEKLPAIKDYPNKATTDPDQIRQWWAWEPNANIGISTTRYDEDKALCVVDIDTKGDKHGDQTLLRLELSGAEFPVTCEHSTPSGGRHLIYVCGEPLKQGVDVLGSGLDIRSRGGYIVAPGSQIDGRPYTQINGHGTLADCPAWLRVRLGVDRGRGSVDRSPLVGVDPDRARDRAIALLKAAAPAVQGEGGDIATFKLACQVKDYGCTQDEATLLMDEHWNERCLPPWSLEDLATKVRNAFKHGTEAPGSAAPEAVFPPVTPKTDEPEAPSHPVHGLNAHYAFVKSGAFVLNETTDAKGGFTTEHLSLAEFHAWHANRPFQVGNQRPKPVSQHWMEWSGRRQYDGVVFSPEKDPGPRWYNLWRGFAHTPAADSNHPAVAAFMEHALQNVCNNDPDLFRYLMGYFAHMIQRPWEKPLVSLVFQGGKGVGKNALVERVGALLGSHFLVADDDRYLLGNFNSHLESNLCFVLDEAAWAGDKRAEGRLKGLITGAKHNIERKGKEPYQVDNLTRVIILGNEDWLVPASVDERRFAVFQVGEGRKQDRDFFIGMREGMEAGGYAHLLRLLLDFDLSTVDVNNAPKTQALVDQKVASLKLHEEWWLDCLQSGHISGGDFAGQWPDLIPTNRLREAYLRWAKGRNVKGRLPSEDMLGRWISRMAPSFKKVKTAKAEGDSSYSRAFPGLEKLRKDFDKHIDGGIEWL